MFQRALTQLGLNDKEAAVYEASLALGPSTVQKISRKARIARATTYLIINSLKQKQLMYEVKEADHTLYSAESPAQLERILEQRENDIHVQRHLLQQLMPQLLAYRSEQDQAPAIRYYEGIAGIEAMRGEMSRLPASSGTWDTIVPADEVIAVFGVDFLRNPGRVARGIHSRMLFTTKSNQTKEFMLATAKEDLSERKVLSPRRYPSNSGFIVFSNRFAIGNFSANGSSIVIESDSITAMMRSVFESMWRECR